MRLSKEKLERAVLPQADGLRQALESVPETGGICAATLQAVSPLLAAIAPEPSEGWLACAYAALTDGLFPDPDYRAPSEAVRQGIALLTAALETAMACENRPFDPLTDLLPFDETLRESSRVEQEYIRFEEAVSEAHFMTVLRLAREVMPFDPASHTIGVRNVAVHTASLAQQAGLPADVPLVAAAALCHDIGKFACRGEDAKRVPYLHYYYTWQWLLDRGMEEIAHISANHSTWDLEFENLPIESLLLIYADFRVRGTRENGREIIRIYSLAEAYGMIMSKLADVTPAKKRRYRLVYSKLRDFERFLLDRGVGTELDCAEPQKRPPQDAALPETLVTGEMPGEVRSWALTFYGICRCCAADDHKENNKENKEKN